MSWPFGDLRPLQYGLVLADPAWDFKTHGPAGQARCASAHYDVMPAEEIQALPVGHLASRDCILVMWSTFPHLDQAMQTLKAWGFRYSTGGVWAKRTARDRDWHMGMGYRFRSAAEPYLIGTVGEPPIRDRAIRNLIVAPVREHSRKPDDMYEICERLSPGPYVELFARTRRPGWDAWGNQTDRFPTEAA